MLSSFGRAALVAATLSSACSQSAPRPAVPTSPAEVTAPAPSMPIRLSPPEVIARVAARYPERLAEGVSLDARMANMAFLRDRIIETGICGGLNLAWNQKTSGLRSIDAINWRHGDDDVNDVVDLAFGYDDTDRPLALRWHITHGPAGWDPFPPPSCP